MLTIENILMAKFATFEGVRYLRSCKTLLVKCHFHIQEIYAINDIDLFIAVQTYTSYHHLSKAQHFSTRSNTGFTPARLNVVLFLTYPATRFGNPNHQLN